MSEINIFSKIFMFESLYFGQNMSVKPAPDLYITQENHELLVKIKDDWLASVRSQEAVIRSCIIILMLISDT